MILEDILVTIEGQSLESGFDRVVVTVCSFAICTPGKTWSNQSTNFKHDPHTKLSILITLTCATRKSLYTERFLISGLTPTKTSPRACAAADASCCGFASSFSVYDLKREYNT